MNRFLTVLALFNAVVVFQLFKSVSSASPAICMGYCNTSCSCTENYTFQCKDGTCFPLRKWRNHVVDCADGSDESITCCDGYFKCDTKGVNKIGKCLPKKLLNNQQTECLDGTDEDKNNNDGCSDFEQRASKTNVASYLYYYTCQPAQPAFSKTGKCITIDFVLDGKYDCPLGDDEDGLNFDECQLDRDNCDENADCENDPKGSYTCKCKSGFTGDGLKCSPSASNNIGG